MAPTFSNTAAEFHSSRQPRSDAFVMVDEVSALVSPPDICLRIFELLQSPDSSAREIGDVISQDPNLTARLLKVVNSPFYGVGRRVDTVSRAIAIVGIRDLYNLVVAVSAVNRFSHIAIDLVNMDTFWRHSLFTALLSRALAKRAGILHPERLFVAGLLHEIGALVLYHKMPRLAQEHLLLAGGDEAVIFEQEYEQLGFTHAELGAML
ncbi:MAG: HDOD domain-containing protein, partial [Pseudomonadota bacterium]